MCYLKVKQLLQLNSRKINDPNKRWAKELNRHFSKKDIQMVNKLRISIYEFGGGTIQSITFTL